MYQNKRILAIVPARGGSKGIPNKNIIDLCGKPLLAYSIEAGLKSKYIDKVLVSTDSSKIREIAQAYGADAPFLRPAELSTDTAKTIDCMLHAIQYLREQKDYYNYVVLLQPTQPIRHPQWIDDAIEHLVESKQDSLVSVCPVTQHPILMRTIKKDGALQSILPMQSTVRRQDFPDIYTVNGSIYINCINENFNRETSLNDNLVPYIMPKEVSIDIDNLEDLKTAAAYLSQN